MNCAMFKSCAFRANVALSSPLLEAASISLTSGAHPDIPDNPDLYDYMTGIKYLNFITKTKKLYLSNNDTSRVFDDISHRQIIIRIERINTRLRRELL